MNFPVRSLLLCTLACLPWYVSHQLDITQPHSLTVTEGDTVNIWCNWTIDKYLGENVQVRVEWLMGQTQQNTSLNMLMNTSCCQGPLRNETCNCSSLTLLNVTRKDSGKYMCKVTIEIPRLSQFTGNGTVLKVNPRETHGANATDKSNVQLLYSITAVAVVLFLLTCSCLYCLHRRRAMALRVIYEVPHFDSEEGEKEEQRKQSEMEGSSTTSSKGSTQWCQVLVYESVDYFEGVESKDGK